MLRNLKLRTRLILGFGVVLAFMAVTSLYALYSLEQISSLNSTISEAIDLQVLAGQWKANSRVNLERALVLVRTGGGMGLASVLKPRVEATSAEIAEVQKLLEARVQDPAGRAALALVAEKRSAYLRLRGEIIAAMHDDEEHARARIDRELVPLAQTYIAAIEAFETAQVQIMEGARTDVDDAFRRTRLIMIGLALAALAAGIFVALRITRFIVRRLQFTVEQTRSVAQGDLTHAGEACGSADEIGELEGALSQMRLTLRELVLRIRGATEGVATASSQIASGGQDLSARSESAASSLEQTSHSIADLSGSVELTSSTALRANQLAATASDAARRGGDVMEQVVGTMGEINVASRRIADIIGVIDGIAFQTNILALNAAVESARAGEQGRGFAVVASEVRSLAQRSATAAREIKSLIDDSVGKVQSGSRQVEEAGQAMGEIVAKVGQVATMIGEISTAAQAQQSSMGEVRGAISRIDGMTQQNSALVEQSAAATANLRDQAHALAEAVRIFRVDPQVA